MNKKETVYEAAEKYAIYHFDSSFENVDDHFIAGAKWQQDKDKYSEEEVLDLLNKREQYLIETIEEFYQSNLEWFEQFKK